MYNANMKIKIILIPLLIITMILPIVFYINKTDNNSLNNLQEKDTMKKGTIEEKLSNTKVAVRIGNDHFTGTEEEQNKIVDMFISDNSKSDSVDLYRAANTANLLNRTKDAMFLFYAAQLRKAFDYKRFGLDERDMEMEYVSTIEYLEYLNYESGVDINPLVIQNPKQFSEVIRILETWNIIPSDDSYKYRDDYVIKKESWEKTAKEIKDSFLNEFAYKQEKLLSDTQTLEMMRFIQDYNFGNIPNTEENGEKSIKYLEIINSLQNQ
jgi:hypothetical protein